MRIGLLEYMEFAVQYGEMKSGQSHDVYATCDNVDRAKASQSAEFFFFLFLFLFYIFFCILFVPCAKAFTQRLRRWWLSWSATVITATWHQSDSNIRNKKKKYIIIIGRNKELGQLAQLASYLVGPVAVLLANASCVCSSSNVAYAYYLMQVEKWQHE